MPDMFEFSGMEQLLKELENIEGNIDEKVKDEALIAGAEVVVKQMKQEVYAHGLHHRSGTAEKSITHTKPENGEIVIGPDKDAFYLYFHEMGYYNVRAQKFMSPKPFASIAFEHARDKVLDEEAKVVRKGMGMT